MHTQKCLHRGVYVASRMDPQMLKYKYSQSMQCNELCCTHTYHFQIDRLYSALCRIYCPVSFYLILHWHSVDGLYHLFYFEVCTHTPADLCIATGTWYANAQKYCRQGGLSHAFQFTDAHTHKTNSVFFGVGLGVSHRNVNNSSLWVTGSTTYCYSVFYVTWRRAAGWEAYIFLNDSLS